MLPGPQERISERNVEQIAVSRGFGEGLQDLLPGQSSSSSSHDPARVAEALDEPGEGFFFALFHKLKKKCETGSALESESVFQCQLIHASSSSAHTSQRLGHDPHGSGALLLGPPHWRDTLDDGGWVRAFLVFGD